MPRTRKSILTYSFLLHIYLILHYGNAIQPALSFIKQRAPTTNTKQLSSSSIPTNHAIAIPPSHTPPEPINLRKKSILILPILTTLSLLSIFQIPQTRTKLTTLSSSLQTQLGSTLHSFSSIGFLGHIYYTLAMILWETFIGVTSPLETAAGMAFGFKYGSLYSALGKTSGALLAFLMGRCVLHTKMTKMVNKLSVAELMRRSFEKNPVRVALVWRFSFLPEVVKNYGLAVMPVGFWEFAAAVMVHGVPFTLLWSFIGSEMGLVARGVVAEPSKVLKVLLGGVYVFGFFLSPLFVGLWIKGLKEDQKSVEEQIK